MKKVDCKIIETGFALLPEPPALKYRSIHH